MLQVYTRPILLDRRHHHDLRLSSQQDFAFACKTNSVTLNGEEFASASGCSPIAFVEVDHQQFFPVVLLGVRSGENLFASPGCPWEQGCYIPAVVRRHPFVLAKDGHVCVDTLAPNLKGEGLPLFDRDGAITPALQQTLSFLTAFQRATDATQAFANRLAELDLLVDWPVQTTASNGEVYRMEALRIVDEHRLAALPNAVVLELWRSGELSWIQAHHLSLSRLDDLFARFHRQPTRLAA